MPIVGEHSETEGIIVNVTPQVKAPAVHVDAPNVTVHPRVTVSAPSVKAPDVRVNVEAPSVTVNPPSVTVEAPSVTVEASKIKGWTFEVSRNSEGLIETITATPN